METVVFPQFFSCTKTRQASWCVYRSRSERCASSRWEIQSGVKIMGQGRTTASRRVKMCNLWVVPIEVCLSLWDFKVQCGWSMICFECKQSSRVRVGMYSLTEYYWFSVHVNRNLLAFVLSLIVSTFVLLQNLTFKKEAVACFAATIQGMRLRMFCYYVLMQHGTCLLWGSIKDSSLLHSLA